MGLKWRRKGTGQNLSELAPGRWKVSVNLPAGQNPDGKRHRRVAYVDDGKRAAEAKRRELLTARDQGKLKPRTAGTVVEYLERWLDRETAYRRRRAPPHVGEPTSVARSRPNWRGKLLRDVRRDDGTEILRHVARRGPERHDDSEGAQPATHGVQSGHTRGQPGRQSLLGVRAPAIDTPEAKALNEDEANRLLEALRNSPIYVPVLVTLDCGLRRGGAAGPANGPIWT